MKKLLKIGLLCSLLLVCGQGIAAALEDFSVLILGPLDGRAVIKLPDGKMQVVGTGQTLPGTQATVKQILSDRLVVEDLLEGDPPAAQTVWLYKAANPGEKSRVQRLHKTPPAQSLPDLKIGKKLKQDQ